MPTTFPSYSMSNIDPICKVQPFIINPPFPAGKMFKVNFVTQFNAANSPLQPPVIFTTTQVCENSPGQVLAAPVIQYEALTSDGLVYTNPAAEVFQLFSNGDLLVRTTALSITYKFKIRATLTNYPFVSLITDYEITPDTNQYPQWTPPEPFQSYIKVLMQTEYRFQVQCTDPEDHFISVVLYGNPSFITVSVNTVSGKEILIKPTDVSHFGVFTIQVEIQDIYGKIQPIKKTIVIEVPNYPPYFMNAIGPEDIEVPINKITYYEFPAKRDPELQEVQINNTKLPPYVTFNGTHYMIEPIGIQGYDEVQGYITDGIHNVYFGFYITVINKFPKFITEPRDQKLLLNSIAIYLLPEIEEPDFQPVSLIAHSQGSLKLPSFVTFDNSSKTFYMQPELEEHLGLHSIIIEMTDYVCKPIIYEFKIWVNNFTREEKNRTIMLPPNITEDEFAPIIEDRQMLIGRVLINEIRRNQFAILKVIPATYAKLYLRNITNQTLKLEIPTRDNETVNFTIKGINIPKAEIYVDLKFKNWKLISNQVDPDFLRSVILQKMHFRDKKTQNIIYFREGQYSERQIPPQVIGKMGKIVGLIRRGKLMFSDSMFANFLLALLIQIIFGYFNDMSFLTINTMISMPVPGVVQTVLQVLLSLIYLDLLMTDQWLPQIFSNNEESIVHEDEEALNDYFYENGFQSKLVIKTLGSSFVFLCSYVALIFIYGIIRISAHFFPKLTWMKEKMHLKLFWNFSITLMLSQFAPLTIAAMMNYYQIDFDSQIHSYSVIFCIFISIVLPIGYFSSLYVLKKNQARLKKKGFTKQFKNLIDGNDKKRLIGVYWNLIILGRWLMTNLVIVFVRQFYTLQIFVLLIMSVISQCLMIIGNPRDNFRDNAIDLFTEFCVSLYLYILLVLTDFWGENLYRELEGLILVIIVMTVIAINLLNFCYNIFKAAQKFYRKRCRKNKKEPEEKEEPIEKEKPLPAEEKKDESEIVKEQSVQLPNTGFDIRKAYNLHAVQGKFQEKLYDTKNPNQSGRPVLEVADPANPQLFQDVLSGTGSFLLPTQVNPPQFRFAMSTVDLATYERSWGKPPNPLAGGPVTNRAGNKGKKKPALKNQKQNKTEQKLKVIYTCEEEDEKGV